MIGGGPAGLAAATALRRTGAGRVALLEREAELGGVTRDVAHRGFGREDLRRLLRGPDYAHVWARRAERAGVDLLTASTVTGWCGAPADRRLEVTTPGWRGNIDAGAIVLATGSYERPRAARLVPGTRPGGVLTTMSLLRLVAAGHWVGNRAVVVGSEAVSYSAVRVLRHAGVRVIAMVTEASRPEASSVPAFTARCVWRVPLFTATRVERVLGRTRVQAIELSGWRRPLDCDTVVFTGECVAEATLATGAGIALRTVSSTRDVSACRTSVPGIFAAGNVLHCTSTAGSCALEGRALAPLVGAWLANGTWPEDGLR